MPPRSGYKINTVKQWMKRDGITQQGYVVNETTFVPFENKGRVYQAVKQWIANGNSVEEA